MWLPANPDKIPRFFLPCPSNDENNLEPGMIGIKDVAGTDRQELWARPPRVNEGDAEPDPFLIGNAADIGSPDYIDFNTDPGPLLTQEGRVAWNGEEYTINVDTGLGSVIQVGHETMIIYYNDTGSEITNGSVVRPSSATLISGHIFPTPELAKADNHATCEGTLAFATHDIANGSIGLMTRFGRVREWDLSSFSSGDTGWLSATVAGEITNTKPVFPNFSISLGGVLNNDVAEGEFFVSITRNVYNIFNDAHDGSFIETLKFIVTSDGATVTGSLTNSADSGRDMTMIFSDGFTTMDTTPAATITLTAGTDIAPQRGYIYVLQSTKVLTLSTSEWPIVEHIKVADVFIQSAASVQTEGARVNRNWNDHLKSEGDNGHLLHIAERLRREHAQWDSGMEGVTTVVASAVDFSVTSGFAYQLHRQSFPALDTSLGAPVYFVNEFTTPYYKTTDIEDVTDDASGNPLNNTSYSIVYWVVQNRTGEPCHIMANMPSGTYSRITPVNAVDDAENKSVYAFPEAFRGKGVLIARCTYVNTNGTITLYDTENLRGKIPNATAGGGAGGTGVTTFLGLSDTGSSYAGNAGKVPNVNAGETALEFVELSTDKTLNGNGTDTPFSLVPSIPLDTGDSYEFTQNSKTGSTDKSAVTNRDLTALRNGEVLTTYDGYLAASGKYLMLSNTNNDLILLDKHTLNELGTETSTTIGQPVFVSEELGYVIRPAEFFRVLTIPFTVSSSQSLALGTEIRDVVCGPDCLVYYIDNTGASYLLKYFDPSDETVTTVGSPLTGITGSILSLDISHDGTIIFALEKDGSTLYVRKYSMSGGAPSLSSSVITATSATSHRMCIYGSEVHVFVSTGSVVSDTILDQSTLTEIFDGVATADGALSTCRDGLLYTKNSSYEIVETQLPALTVEHPDFIVSLGGGAAISANGVKNSDGTLSQITKEDWIRAVLDHVNNTPRRPSIRTTSAAASTVELTDEGNIIISDNVANVIAFTADADVLAIDGFIFTVWPTTHYDTYAVTINISASTVQPYKLDQGIPVEADESSPLRAFKFIVMESIIRPYDGTCERVAPV